MLRKSLLAILLSLALAAPASAAVTITFYSREFGERFPHAFVELSGTLDQDGTPVSGSWGFTAKTLSPAILMGSVEGVVERVTDLYKRGSNPHFALTITDAQYRDVYAIIEEWRTRTGKDYNLNQRNCVHFVGELARASGLKVVNEQRLMKRPTSYLLNIKQLNPSLNGAPAIAAPR